MVIGNILETRKREVILVTPDNVTPIRLKNLDISKGVEIEQYLVEQLIKGHQSYISKHVAQVSNKDDQEKENEDSN